MSSILFAGTFRRLLGDEPDEKTGVAVGLHGHPEEDVIRRGAIAQNDMDDPHTQVVTAGVRRMP